MKPIGKAPDPHAGSNGDGIDSSMFCNPLLNVCVKSCQNHDDCPPAWVCDDRGQTLTATASTQRDASDTSRPNGSPICINPSCANGDDTQ